MRDLYKWALKEAGLVPNPVEYAVKFPSMKMRTAMFKRNLKELPQKQSETILPYSNDYVNMFNKLFGMGNRFNLNRFRQLFNG